MIHSITSQLSCAATVEVEFKQSIDDPFCLADTEFLMEAGYMDTTGLHCRLRTVNIPFFPKHLLFTARSLATIQASIQYT